MNSPKHCVLIVEDDEDDYFLISSALQECTRSDYSLQWSHSYDDALSQLTEKKYDACLVDYRLGRQTGLDLVGKAISIGCSIPMILLTGAKESDVDLLAMQVGAMDFLEKGTYDSELFDRAIRYAIERRRTEADLLRTAQNDPLTGLANRSHFKSRLTDALDRATRGNRGLAVLFIDLDGFKPVNDTLGHKVGDQVLIMTSSRLLDCVRSIDTVGRIGGDEFVLILEEFSHQRDVSIIAQRILEAIVVPFYIDHQKIEISASIGISMFPQDGNTPEILLHHADTAMYIAKNQGKATFEFFNSKIEILRPKSALLRSDASQAMSNGAFRLHYQPQAHTMTNTIVGVEALLRWRQNGQLIAPNLFVPDLERSGLIVPVGEWVIRQACTDLRSWLEGGMVSLRMAINISPRQLVEGHRLIDHIYETLKQTGIPAEYLDLELTENFVIQDIDHSCSILRQLKEGGVRLSLDDFGVGNSNLNYLQHFPFDAIKLDQGFIVNIPETDNGILAAAIIGLGDRIGLDVVAEGVETSQQLEFIRSLGCNFYQGYLLSRPISGSLCLKIFSNRFGFAA